MNRLYITFSEQYDSEYDEITRTWKRIPLIPLGYASASNKSGVFNEKKMKSQNEWAYQGQADANGEFWNPNHYSNIGKTLYKHQPIYVDNIPQNGFKIESVQSRYSTNNKLFRILDPRGFELEISADNLLNLMNTTIIDHGTIMDACIWDFGKNGIGKAKLVVAP